MEKGKTRIVYTLHRTHGVWYINTLSGMSLKQSNIPCDDTTYQTMRTIEIMSNQQTHKRVSLREYIRIFGLSIYFGPIVA